MFPVAALCRVLKVSHSGYYAWLNRPPSARAKRDAMLVPQIIASHERSDNTYGSPRILGDLKDQGEFVGRKRVARLMRMTGIVGVSRRRFVLTTKRSARDEAPPDLVERNFKAERPNQLWVANITYVPTWAGFLFLAIVLDAFSRRIVGWAMATHLKTELVLNALEMAIAQRKPDGVVHHSDHGCQYTSLAFGKRCGEMGIRPSVGSVGDAYDNAMAESFFATLECELLNRRRFRTHVEARHAIFRFIEGWYNPHRRHSSLGNISPVSYEKLASTAA